MMSAIIRGSVLRGARKIGKYHEGERAKVEHAQEYGPEEAKQSKSIAEYELEIENLISQLEEAKSKLAKYSDEIALLKGKNGELVRRVSEYTESIDQEKSNAKADGYQEGRKKAEIECKFEYDNFVKETESEYAEQLDLLQKVTEANWSDLFEWAAEVGFEIGCKILGESYCKNDGLKAQIITSLQTASVKLKCPIRMRMCSEDLVRFDKMRDAIELKMNCELVAEADSKIETGGVIIESNSGIWDARLDKQLKIIKKALQNVSNEVLV
ncbi:hypothetical protein [Microbulbifer sp. TYP-18]|uniref:FliH/SctL family protein n=1 Tax=Microbulbifer sp. TYP-18 TaxID=3230024 RepID=UPI0034C66D69